MIRYRILALDGGGLRGLLTTMLLERLCRQPGLAQAFDSVDLIAGNSSGALIALAMGHGLRQPTMLGTLAAIRQVFERGRETFGPGLPWWLGGFWLLSRYGTRAREDGLKKVLGDKRLKDLNHNVLIPAFDLDNKSRGNERPGDPRMWKPKLFHNFAGENSDEDMPAWQVGLYSSAAPAYFPTVDGYSDGGAYANNPSMCALAQVYDARYAPEPKPALEEVALLSVGAGQNLKYVRRWINNWGLVSWAPRFVPLTMDGTTGVADYECRQMLGDRNYKRLCPAFPEGLEIKLDDFERLDYLMRFADQPEVIAEVERCAEWMREHWMPGLPAGPAFPETTSKHVGTATELTCLMPIKSGFLPMLDTRTYATRLRIVFKVLQSLRVLAREVLALKPIVDIVEAAGTVHAFSWSIVQERQLLLSVSFDRPWEPYIRVVWKDLGPLLDLFLCNCDGFVPSTEGFEPFAAFVRRHQVDTSFFYPSSSMTVDDERYLAEFEKLQRSASKSFQNEAATLVAPGPEELAEAVRNQHPEQAAEQWLAAVNALYLLRNVYPEGSKDHVFLHRAARTLLDSSRPKEYWLEPTPALEWFDSKQYDSPSIDARRPVDRSNVQGGILEPYHKVTHGCMLLATIEDATRARQFISESIGEVTRDARDHERDDISMNLAFTFGGLKQLGVNESDLARFPKEFREGMEARAGLLGDVRQNHPENWTLPEWNVKFNGAEPEFIGSLVKPVATESVAPPVRMSTVDVVITLHKAHARYATHDWTEDHPLYWSVEKLCRHAKAQGIRVLSVQPMRRLKKSGNRETRRFSYDHFGFLDGISQPTAADQPRKPDEVEIGELLVGFQNQRGDPPFRDESAEPTSWTRGSLIDSGSFLVVRKLQQNVGALHEIVEKAATDESLAPEVLYAKMVGRSRDGDPLVEGAKGPTNHFDFDRDPNGERCPFHAHIRRGNPRLKTASGAASPRVPRIARRALAYGPPVDENPYVDDRGMMFLAYNASIAEQFEIIQRWMSGGNTPAAKGGTAVFSGQPDCLLGLPDSDGKRTYRFLHDGTPHQVDLGNEPFVTLQWGMYLFTPSIAALEILTKGPVPDVATAEVMVAFGSRVIQSLQTRDQWAAVLEDVTAIQSGTTAAVYAAIRKRFDGALRTPYGVLIANEKLALEVLRGGPGFSVSEYRHRFVRSVGQSYLGLDRGEEYAGLSRANDALDAVTEKQACEEAYGVTRKVFDHAIEQASPSLADGSKQIPLEPVIDLVIARLAQEWFDIPDGRLIMVGGRPASGAQTLHCPFHLLAPSRYVFSSPNPRDEVRELGEAHGQRLLEQAKQFVKECREGNRTLAGPISKRLDGMEAFKANDDLFARILLGLVFGFGPTVYGNALQVLGLWLGDETLWRMQQRWLAASGDLYERASSVLSDPLKRAIQARPVPALLYRTVRFGPMKLGGIDLKTGDRVVIGMSGVTDDIASRKKSDVMPVFGGDRKGDNPPTHACPGYHIAMGVLVGLIARILDTGTLSPGPGLVTVKVTEWEPEQAHAHQEEPKPALLIDEVAVT